MVKNTSNPNYKSAIVIENSLIKNNNQAQDILEFNENKSELYIFPNPAKDILNIQLTNINNNIYSFDVYNITGNKIYSKLNCVNDKHTLNVANWDRGVYIILIKGDINFSRKIIIE